MKLPSSRGFTLIELLVVIAIIAILAAILFPVFAQAKVAAKKTASLSNVKQLNTGTQIYLADSDDTFPTETGQYNGRWYYDSWNAVPYNWSNYPGLSTWSQGAWANCIAPYVKNTQIYESPAGTDLTVAFYTTAAATKVGTPAKTGYGYNGDLSSFSASGVTSPATCPLATQAGGRDNVVGFDTGPFPALACDTSGPCVFKSVSSSSCNNFSNGSFEYFFYGYNSEWMYGQVQTWTYADGHAGIRRMGLQYGTGTRTDYRQDPFANYPKADGKPGTLAWYDQYYCHALLFAPDFDGTTISGTPYAGY